MKKSKISLPGSTTPHISNQIDAAAVECRLVWDTEWVGGQSGSHWFSTGLCVRL